MKLLWDRIRDWVILVVFLLIAMLVMVNVNTPLLRSLRAVSLGVTSQIEQYFAWAGTYIRALDENDELRDNNMNLFSQVALLREANLENERLKAMLQLRDTTVYDMIATRIISKDISKQENYFTIERGSEDGIQEDMAVIDDQGILGKVLLVGKNYALVQSYLNTEFRVRVQIQPLQIDGIVGWDGNRLDQLLLDHIVKTEPVEKGQPVVTSHSTVFPPGLSVGTVDSVVVRETENVFTIFLTPASPLSTADYVFVIRSVPPPEVNTLQEQLQ